MENVTDFFSPKGLRTRVLVTAVAEREMDKVVNDMAILVKLEECAENGFANYTGEWPLRPEGHGVWAFGIRKSLVRLAGYFPIADRSLFVIGGAYRKKGQEIGAKGEAVIERVKVLKEAGVNVPQV